MKLLIINKIQFGYHTDYYKFCEYLKDDFSVIYLCFDLQLKKLSIPNVKVVYVPYRGIKTMRGMLFVLYALLYCFQFSGGIFIHYFEQCQFIKKLFFWKKMILDIRTLNISPHQMVRAKGDEKLKKACNYFDYVTVISEGIKQKLQLHETNTSLLPLGSDQISNTEKEFSNLKLLYVGTFNGRNINDTINGFAQFCKQHPEFDNITYDIIGDGQEFDQLKKLVESLNLTDQVTLHGRIPHVELQSFFDKCNVGVSYVPITEYYEYQPVTKTYEYILSGMATIATRTYENKLVINELNGILCKDTSEDFANALAVLFNKFNEFNSNTIRNTLADCEWGQIVNKKLIPVLKSIY